MQSRPTICARIERRCVRMWHISMTSTCIYSCFKYIDAQATLFIRWRKITFCICEARRFRSQALLYRMETVAEKRKKESKSFNLICCNTTFFEEIHNIIIEFWFLERFRRLIWLVATFFAAGKLTYSTVKTITTIFLKETLISHNRGTRCNNRNELLDADVLCERPK